jgi:hypothetical protein
LGRTDGAIALYDNIMKSENASCVIDSHAVAPITSVDVATDGSMIVWTTDEFVFFTCVVAGHWAKGAKEPKPKVIMLRMSEADRLEFSAELEDPPPWRPIKFDAATHSDEHGLYEREMISYFGRLQVRWNVRQARRAWQAHTDDEEKPGSFDGKTTDMHATVNRHMTVGEDSDIVALEGEIVKSLHF